MRPSVRTWRRGALHVFEEVADPVRHRVGRRRLPRKRCPCHSSGGTGGEGAYRLPPASALAVPLPELAQDHLLGSPPGGSAVPIDSSPLVCALVRTASLLAL